MEKKLECGHSTEEHLAATLILAFCESVHMPYEVLRAACKLIGDGEHDADVEVETEKKVTTKTVVTPIAPLAHE